MSQSTYPLRRDFVNIARRNVGNKEVSKNDAPWIRPLWTATNDPTAWRDKAAYCAAGMAWCLREWLRSAAVRLALGLATPEAAEAWRCKSASCFKNPGDNWLLWAKQKKLTILPKNCILHSGDLVIYDYSHIEMVSDDDGTETGAFVAVGYNTNSAGSRDGEGCYEKPRSRGEVKCFIRILE